jgi:DeoR/GlpR family transcriptional regulator of sugar metabolism
MSENASARRMRLLEELSEETDGKDLESYARLLRVDDRTIRRDVDHLQDLVSSIRGIEVRKGHVFASRDGYGPGYFNDQVGHRQDVKEAIARHIVDSLGDNLAVVITAGSTTYFVAREIRRAHIEEERPRNLIALTNSLPALMELIAGGVSTGVVGEVYDPDDCAFHSHELRTAFHPSICIVGASGVVTNPSSGTLDLFTQRAEEAAFMKQLLGPVPEIIVAADAPKVGRRHPWSFTDGGLLAGKTVRLVTDALEPQQSESLDELTKTAGRKGWRFGYEQVVG